MAKRTKCFPTNFEGPLKPGKGALPPDSPTFEGPLPGPGRIRVPRSPITDPRDLLPKMPVADASEATIKKSVVEKMIESVRKKADAKGYRRGRAVGFAAGYDSGYQKGGDDARNMFL